MIVKTFKGGRTSKGASSTIAYLLNERVAEGTAKVLWGDSKLTQKIINIAEKKQKWSWSSGVLSFTEKIEDRKILEDIKNEFEKTFFAGLEENQYNILWVLHEDKGRTELHYITPRLELTTGLSYNPYFVTRDFAKKDLFQEYINLKYNLNSPKDNKKITFEPPKWRDNAKKKDIRQAFDDALLPLIKEDIISSREELIYQLEEWGFELNRVGKEYLSVTDENGKNHRLKGIIYGESFTSWEAVERKAEADGRTVANGVQRELDRVRNKLDTIISVQAKKNRDKYNRTVHQRDGRTQKRELEFLQKNDNGREEKLGSRIDKMEKNDNLFSPYCPYIWLVARDIYYPIPYTKRGFSDNKRERDSKKFKWDEVYTNNKGVKNQDNQRRLDDSTRTEAIRRIGEAREQSEQRTARIRAELKDAIRANGKTIQAEFSRYNEQREQRGRQLNSILTNANRTEQPNYQAIARTAQRRGHSREVETHLIGIFRHFGGKLNSFKQRIDRANQPLIKELRERITDTIKDKAMQELNRFKTDINLAEFCTAFGYYKDKDKSSLNAPVMRHENGDRIVIGKDKSDGHYIYFNPNNNSDSGTIVDFVKNRTGETLGHIRKRLRQWLHNPQPQENITVKASTKDAMMIANTWERIKEANHCLTQYWGIGNSKLAQMPKVKYGEDGYFYFMLSNLQGICGIEKRNDTEKHIIAGSEKGIFTDGNINEAKRIVIFESPIDMMSYKELGNGEISDFNICTMGSIGESAEKSLEAIFKRNRDAQIVIAVDNDEGGDKLTNKIAEILNLDGNLERAVRHKPNTKDWNDELRAKQQKQQRQTQSRGLHR